MMSMLSFNDFAAAASLFPIKLYRMVSDSQCQCMSWGGDGEHLVLNTRLFEDELLQQTLIRWKYQLKTTSTTSFIRQLHAYGFRKVIEGYGEPNNIRRYFHPYFHRQRPDLLIFMKRSLRTGPPKKTSLQMYDDSSSIHEALSNSMFQLPPPPPPAVLESMRCAFSLTPNQEVTPNEESEPPRPESSSKRRRKAHPRKHPSFEEYNCEMEEDQEEYSPPTMVTRSRFKQIQLGKKIPEMTLDDKISSNIPIVKQEAREEVAASQKFYSNSLEQAVPVENKAKHTHVYDGEPVPKKMKSNYEISGIKTTPVFRSNGTSNNLGVTNVFKLPVLPSPTWQHSKTTFAPSPQIRPINPPLISNIGGKSTSKFVLQPPKPFTAGPVVQPTKAPAASIPVFQPRRALVASGPVFRAPQAFFARKPPPQQPKVSNKVTLEEPLDLSRPKPRKFPVYKPEAAVTTNQLRPAVPQHQTPITKQQTTLTVGNGKVNVAKEKSSGALSALNGPQQPQTILITSPVPLHQQLMNTTGAVAKTPSANLPPFPSNPTRISVPPNTILQPAYIAWPTRGIFCPQTKQWIQARPTIIPLPFKSQPVPQSTMPGQGNPKLAISVSQPPWGIDGVRMPVTVESMEFGRKPDGIACSSVGGGDTLAIPRPQVKGFLSLCN